MKPRVVWILAVVLLAGTACSDVKSIGKHNNPGYTVVNGQIFEPGGRSLILRGLNYNNEHKFPGSNGLWFPNWEGPDDFAQMAAWGYNSVRLLLTWEAVEPVQGQYDEAFLNNLALRLDWAQMQGIRVILDMHQDVYSRTFGGDGAPAWAVLTDGLIFHLNSQWYLNFADPAALRAMDNFFADKQGIQTSFIEAWAHVVNRFKDHPALIGYDLLNEPYPGSTAFNLNAADENVLNPFYAKLVKRMAQEDSKHLFFMEPNAVRTNALAGSFPSALAEIKEAKGRLVIAPHLYDPVVTSTGKYDGGSQRIMTSVRKLADEAARLHAGLWVGEWSVWDGHVDGEDAFLRDQLDAMDYVLAGWSFWNYSKNVSDMTSPLQSPNFLHQLARPQLAAVAGVVSQMACTVDRCQFTYAERLNELPTEVLIPPAWSVTVKAAVTPPRLFRIEDRPLGLHALLIQAQTDGDSVTVDVVK